MFASLLQLASRMMDDIAASIHSGQNRLSVDQNLYGRLFSAEEAKVDFVETWGYRQDHRLIFIPKEVLWTCVNSLNFPRNREAILQFTAFP